MVSFELQEKAACLIHQVTSIERVNRIVRLEQEKELSRRLCRRTVRLPLDQQNPQERRGGGGGMGLILDHRVVAIPMEQQQEELQHKHPFMFGQGEPQPLADDLSSDSDVGRDDTLLEDSLDIPEWRDQLWNNNDEDDDCDSKDDNVFNKNIKIRHEDDGQAAIVERFARCKVAMHQILLNSDLKVRKLQYEVAMLQRLYEDAKLQIERYEIKITQLQRQHQEQQQHPPQSSSSFIMKVGNEETTTPDLRVEQHLNKLLSSRTKALDENLKLKKQILLTTSTLYCPSCHTKINSAAAAAQASLTSPAQAPQQTKKRDGNNNNDDNGSASSNKNNKSNTNYHARHPVTSVSQDTHAPQQQQQQVHQTTHRPTFHKTAFAMVQRIGGSNNPKLHRPPPPPVPPYLESDKNANHHHHHLHLVEEHKCQEGRPHQLRPAEKLQRIKMTATNAGAMIRQTGVPWHPLAAELDQLPQRNINGKNTVD